MNFRWKEQLQSLFACTSVSRRAVAPLSRPEDFSGFAVMAPTPVERLTGLCTEGPACIHCRQAEILAMLSSRGQMLMTLYSQDLRPRVTTVLEPSSHAVTSCAAVRWGRELRLPRRFRGIAFCHKQQCFLPLSRLAHGT